MTKLIVLCLTTTAAVSIPGGKRLLLTGFTPIPLVSGKANDNRPSTRPATRTWARP